jgi:hypothetical protein
MAASKMTMSPIRIESRKVPAVPTRMKTRAPQRASSSMAIEVEGAPMLVEVHEIGTPL